jgi:hypothetical protein
MERIDPVRVETHASDLGTLCAIMRQRADPAVGPNTLMTGKDSPQ